MNIIRKDYIFVDVDVHENKESALRSMSQQIANIKEDVNNEQVFQGLMEREGLSTTGFGSGIAMPHAKLEEIKECLAVFKFENPVKWNSLDGAPVNYAFVILAPNENENNIHLQIISKLARKMMNREFVTQLNEYNDVEGLYTYLVNQF